MIVFFIRFRFLTFLQQNSEIFLLHCLNCHRNMQNSLIILRNEKMPINVNNSRIYRDFFYNVPFQGRIRIRIEYSRFWIQGLSYGFVATNFQSGTLQPCTCTEYCFWISLPYSLHFLGGNLVHSFKSMNVLYRAHSYRYGRVSSVFTIN